MNGMFEPWTIGTLRLKNRIVRSATHEGMGRPDGTPSPNLVQLYERIVRGGAGAIITGYAGVARNGRTFANMCMIDGDASLEAYRTITGRLKPYGTPIILQLAHGGSRAQGILTGEEVISPSERGYNEYGDLCREAREEEIRAIIDSFVRAIVRARQAGFDGVQLHAAHGYLLSEFISPRWNRRTDAWGGTLENRMRVVREILGRAREQVGRFPILVKISAHDEHRDGIAERDAVKIARILQDSSCDAIEVSCGYGDFFYTVRMPKVPADAIMHLAPGYRELTALQKRLVRIALRLRRVPRPLHNYNAAAAERIKQEVDIPVLVVGGVRSLQDIVDIISRRKIDGVSLSRPFVIEPDIVERFRSGRQNSSRCIDCGYCLIGVTSAPLRCYYGRLAPG